VSALWKGVWCEANQWTELASGKLSVLVHLPKTGTLYIATTAGGPPTATPSPNAAPGTPEYDFGSVTFAKPFSCTFADGSTSVFGWPAGAGLRVEVQSE